MRPELKNPVPDELRLRRASRAARDLYAMHQAGETTSAAIEAFSRIVGRKVESFEIDAAFGSVDPETFAKRLLLAPGSIPADLSRAEMVELVECILSARGSEFELEFWFECVARSSGNERLSDLIFWPESYFGNAPARELSAEEIVDIAVDDAASQVIALHSRS